MPVISLNQVLILAILHLGFNLMLYLCGHFLLPNSFRKPLALLLIMSFSWSMIAALIFHFHNQGFFAWLTDPSGEKNFGALYSSTMLMLIGCTGLALLWIAFRKRQYGLSVYWLLVSVLYLFLATDEYFSIHEAVIFWRSGYLILGGSVALISLIVMLRGDSELRPMMLLFILGLGVMGVSGIVLDAFSAQNIIDIGPIQLTFIRCQGEFLGVYCRDFGNTEEMLELSGESMALLGLIAIRYRSQGDTAPVIQSRLIYGAGILWLVVLIGWMWILPEIQARFAHPANTDYGDVSLIAYDLSSETVQPGDSLELTLYMQVDKNVDEDYSMSVHLYTRGQPVESFVQDDMALGNFLRPTDAWLPQLAVRNSFTLVIPDDIAMNQSYQLVAILWEGTVNNRIPVQETDLEVFGDGTTLVIEGIAVPDTDTVVSTRSITYGFEPGFTLSDYHLPESVTLGETTTFDFTWDVTDNQTINATQFLHWFNIETDDFFTFDRIPVDGLFPTQDWVAGMQLNDGWEITIPDDMPPGTYRVQTGLYEPVTVTRLAVSDSNGTPVQDDSIILGEIIVNGDE